MSDAWRVLRLSKVLLNSLKRKLSGLDFGAAAGAGTGEGWEVDNEAALRRADGLEDFCVEAENLVDARVLVWG